MRIRTNRESLPDTIRVNQLHGQKILIRHGGSVRYCKRVSADCLDGTPEVDDLVAAFEQALGVGRQVVLDTLGSCFVGLVDVDALDGAAKGLGRVSRVGDALVRGLAADGMVEDEYF